MFRSLLTRIYLALTNGRPGPQALVDHIHTFGPCRTEGFLRYKTCGFCGQKRAC